jgi:glycosyltransferase involved in cell wall biosynthesis
MKHKRIITIYSNEKIEDCELPYKHFRIEDIERADKEQEGVICPLKKSGPKIIIYQRVEWVIGDIETWGYNLAKTFKDKDITFVFESADKEQVRRLGKYANVIIDDLERKYECDIFISANYDGNALILNRVKAKKYYQTIHSDFSKLKEMPGWQNFKLEIDPKYKVLASSETSQKGLKALGIDSTVATNPLAPIGERPLVLLSMTRVSIEKGAKRMLEMAKELRKQGIEFIWLLASTLDNTDEPEIVAELKDMPEFIIIPPSVRNEGLYWLADYCAQLSDTETYCYTIRTALQCKCPLLVTRFPEAEKIVQDGKNGYLLDFDLSDFDAKKIAKNIPKIAEPYHEEPDKTWEEVLSM